MHSSSPFFLPVTVLGALQSFRLTLLRWTGCALYLPVSLIYSNHVKFPCSAHHFALMCYQQKISTLKIISPAGHLCKVEQKRASCWNLGALPRYRPSGHPEPFHFTGIPLRVPGTIVKPFAVSCSFFMPRSLILQLDLFVGCDTAWISSSIRINSACHFTSAIL